MKFIKPIYFLTFSFLPLAGAMAAVELASVFQDNMVLQRGMPVPVWGKAVPGENVTVSFGKQSKSTKAGGDGAWMVELDPLTANAEGQMLEVEGARKCDNVIVGDVWFLSGQSNMGFGLTQGDGGKEATARADYPWLRILLTPKERSNEPLADMKVEWKVATPKTIPWFSAVGFYFAEKIHQEVGVPIGLVDSSWAGAGIDPFIPQDTALPLPQLERTARSKDLGTIFNARIHPTIPMAFRGMLWYQGETNGTDPQYALKQRVLVEALRKIWGYDFPFYYVQVSAWKNEPNKYNPLAGVAIVREQQLKSLDLPNSGMAVTYDIGGDLHPKNKLDVGLRLARWALRDVYGDEDVVVSGPIYKASEVDGNKMRIKFDYGESGLVAGRQISGKPFEGTPDEPLRGFQIAGKDQAWHEAEATISGDQLLVSAPEVTEPVAVRYAFSQNPAEANLYNKPGLPASPFRTDNWELPTPAGK